MAITLSISHCTPWYLVTMTIHKSHVRGLNDRIHLFREPLRSSRLACKSYRDRNMKIPISVTKWLWLLFWKPTVSRYKGVKMMVPRFTDLSHRRDLDMANLTKCWESTNIGGVALDDIRSYQATDSWPSGVPLSTFELSHELLNIWVKSIKSSFLFWTS